MIDYAAHAADLRKIRDTAQAKATETRKEAHRLRTSGAKEAELESLKVVEIGWQNLLVYASEAVRQVEALK